MLLLLSGLLIWCHALWFAFACFALLGQLVLERAPRLEALAKLATVVPIGLMSLVWVRGLTAQRTQSFATDAVWATSPIARLSPRVWGPAAVHIWHWVFAVVLLVWIAWMVGGAVAARRAKDPGVDRALLMTAGIAGAVFLFGPDRFLNTEFFALRWVPLALICLTLALPMPQVPAAVAGTLVTGVFLLLAGHVTRAWTSVQAVELTGLDEALAAVPEATRVVGLDYVRRGQFTQGAPFLNVSAWAAVLHGVETDFSFAEHGNGLVRYRSPRVAPWTRALSGDARRMEPGDYGFFDFALVNAHEDEHLTYANAAPVRPVTVSGRWRLYRVSEPQG